MINTILHHILGEGDVIIVDCQTTASATPNNGQYISSSQNPRFSTASTSSVVSNEESNGNKNDASRPIESQLVIAQVHHDPTMEKNCEEVTDRSALISIDKGKIYE